MLNYLWFLLAVWWFLTIYVFLRRKLNLLIQTGVSTEDESKIFQKRICRLIVIPCIILQLIQICDDLTRPYTLFKENTLSNPWKITSGIFTMVCWIFFLYLIWFTDSLDKNSKYASIFGFPEDSSLTKILLTPFMIVGAVITVLQLIFQ
jgi:hypothetical protein